jgi:hypothetical protein
VAEENDIIICCVFSVCFLSLRSALRSSIWRHKERSDFYLPEKGGDLYKYRVGDPKYLEKVSGKFSTFSSV